MLNNLNEAESLYKSFLRNSSIDGADRNIKKDYKLLFKLYPNKKENLQKGLEIWNKIYKPLKKLDSLNSKWRGASRNEEKLIYILNAIEIIETHLGAEHKEIISWYTVAGNIYKDMKNYKKQIFYLKKILKYNEKQVNIIIEKFYYNKKFDRQILSIKKDLADDYQIIGRLYRSIDNNEEALKYFKKALPIYEQVYTKEDRLDIQNFYGTLSILYQKS